jgi:hypothetical protein
MPKIKIVYDTETSDVEVYMGKKRVDDIYAVFLHQDIENSYKFTLQLFSVDDGILKFKNADVEKEVDSVLFLNKIINYFNLGGGK